MSSRLIALLVAAVTLAGTACSGKPHAVIVAGNSCSETDADQTRCGETPPPEASPAVLICAAMGDGYSWTVDHLCPFACQDAQCIEARDDTVSPEVKLDGLLPPPDADLTDGNVGDPGSPEAQSDEKDLPDGTICEPGTPICIDDKTQGICDWFGQRYEPKPCDEGSACNEGGCLPIVCSPWERKGECMLPTAYARCNATGTKWEAGYCDQNKTCYLGQCVPWICFPDTIICKGLTATQKCVLLPDNTTTWQDLEICKGGMCKDGKCLSACEVNLKENSYIGCDYWAVDLDNVEGGQYEPVAVVVSVPTEEESTAEITITDMTHVPPAPLTPAELQVPDMLVQPGQLKIFMLPTGFDIDGSVLTNKSFQVTSTAPVTVHQFNPLNGANVYTNDASLLLPSNAGGTKYYVMSWPMRTQGYTLRGFLTVIATQEGVTKVDVWPTCPVLGGPNVPSMAPNPPAPYTFYLSRGDVLNLETDGTEGMDLTGTRIETDKKVNVFGGHECANVPLGVNYCDHIEQQLYPVQSWGSHYVGDALAPRNPAQKDVWRILAGKNNVQVALDPQVAGPYLLNEGQWVEFATGGSFDLTATGPVLLGHYMEGSNYPGFDVVCAGDTGIGDPALTLGVPVEQFLSEYIVLTPPAYQEDYINIIAKLEEQSFLTLDGAPIGTPFVPVGSGMVWGVAQVLVPDGVHTIKGDGKILMGVTAYGYDCDVSYAYPGGLSLKSIQ